MYSVNTVYNNYFEEDSVQVVKFEVLKISRERKKNHIRHYAKEWTMSTI